MIKKLTLKNFLSFGGEETIHFNTNNIFGIVGHNSSGKTNILIALDMLKQIIVRSASNSPESLMPLNFCKFNQDYFSKISIEFIIENKVYNYEVEYSFFIKTEELSIDNKRIYLIKREIENNSEEIHNRITSYKNKNNLKINVNYKNTFDTEIDLIHENNKHIRPNASLISMFKFLNESYLSEVYDYFNLFKIQSSAANTAVQVVRDPNFIKIIMDEQYKSKILDLIKLVDKDIDNYKILTKDTNEQALDITIDPVTGEIKTKSSTIDKIDELIFYKNNVEFTHQECSVGVLKLLQLIPSLFHVISNKAIFIVDELDTGLNPIIYPKLLSLFESNSNSRTKLKFNLWFVFYNNFLFARPYDIKLIPALGKINRIGRGLFELGYQEFDSEYAFLRTKDLNYSINALFEVV